MKGISMMPKRALKLANTNEWCLSLIFPAITMRNKHPQMNKNGNGTILIVGRHLVLSELSSYPSLQAFNVGIQRDLSSLRVKLAEH